MELKFVMDGNFDYENEFIEDEVATLEYIDQILANKQYLRDIQYYPKLK